ncbi:lipase [Aphanothece hegewaldii CCALA 016]|uniref:Lipase n=2 Tax=Aphanothece TaxID=1121 RepID=A0A2T1LTR1_9CHRO|nr:lipase [Aphanothece hegewaldii CCALA 016]
MTMVKNPVLLIHGLYDTVTVFDQLSAYLALGGWSVHSLNLIPNYGSAKLEDLASQMADYITNTFSDEQPIDIIGFSMGGLITRYYLQRLDGTKQVQRYINISAPNRGTTVAYSLPLPGIVQMRPDSEFIKDLNKDCQKKLNQVKCTFIWTPYDLMIIPPSSTLLGMGKEIQIPVILHGWMVKDQRVLKVIKEALLEPIV